MFYFKAWCGNKVVYHAAVVIDHHKKVKIALSLVLQHLRLLFFHARCSRRADL